MTSFGNNILYNILNEFKRFASGHGCPYTLEIILDIKLLIGNYRKLLE